MAPDISCSGSRTCQSLKSATWPPWVPFEYKISCLTDSASTTQALFLTHRAEQSKFTKSLCSGKTTQGRGGKRVIGGSRVIRREAARPPPAPTPSTVRLQWYRGCFLPCDGFVAPHRLRFSLIDTIYVGLLKRGNLQWARGTSKFRLRTTALTCLLYTCVLHCPRKKTDIAKSPDNIDNGNTSAGVFFTRTLRFSTQPRPFPARTTLADRIRAPWCTAVSVPKRQHFSGPPSGRTSLLNFENVVPDA